MKSPIAPFILICIALIYTVFSYDILKWIINTTGILSDFKYKYIIATLSDVIICTIIAIYIFNNKKDYKFNFFEYFKNPVKPVIMAILIFTIAVTILELSGAEFAMPPFKTIIWNCILGPIAEEYVYRLVALLILIKACGFRPLYAYLIPAIIFGIAHFGQGSTISEIIPIILITGFGGLFFGWLFIKWDFNIIPPILAHIGMNSLWSLYNLGENAIGGQMGNIIRALIIILFISMTLYLTKPMKIRAF